MSSRGFYPQCRAGETQGPDASGQTTGPVRPSLTPEYIRSAKASGQADICPGCGQFVRLGRGRLFIEHRYRTGSGKSSQCQGGGRYSSLPWPPTFKGIETPAFLLAESVSGTFPPPEAK